jgi:hypothetical protein
MPEALPPCTALPLAEPPEGHSSSGEFVVDDTNIYMAQGNGLVAWPKSGAPSWFMVSGETVRSLTLDASSLYFSGDRVSRVSKTGGAVDVLYDQPTDAVLAVEDFVYFSNYGPGGGTTIRRWSERTGSEPVAALHDGGRYERLAYRDGYLYTMALATQGARASRVRLADGTEESIADDIGVPRGFVVAGSSLYFTQESTQSVQSLSLTDGTRATVTRFTGFPGAIDSDGKLIYLVVQYLNPDTKFYTSALVRLSVDGKNACTVGSAANFARLFMQGDHVYWLGDCWLQGAR